MNATAGFGEPPGRREQPGAVQVLRRHAPAEVSARIDIAGLATIAAFLASDEAPYLTGQTVFPDGRRLALYYTVPVSAGG